MYRERKPDRTGLAPALAITVRKRQAKQLDKAGIPKRARSRSRSLPPAKRRRSRTPRPSTSKQADLRDRLTYQRDSFMEDRVLAAPKGRSPRSRAQEHTPPPVKRRYAGTPTEGTPEIFDPEDEYTYDVQVDRARKRKITPDRRVIYPDGYEDDE